MSSYSEYKKAAFLSYINLALTIVLGIFTTPYIIKMLGDSEYGLYTLIGAFVGYLSVLDLGLNDAIVRYVAQYKAQNDKKSEANFLAICFIIYLFISLLIIALGVVFYYSIDSLYGNTLTVSELSQAKIMTLILIANLALTVPGGAFAGICSGYEKFIFPRLITIIKYLVRIILLFVILHFGSNALGIVILDTIMNILYIAFTGYYVFSKLKVSIKLYEFNFSYIKDIFNFSVWVFLFALTYQLQWRTGQIVLGTNTTTIAVGVFGVGVMLGIYYTSFGNLINGLFTPKAVQSVYNGMSNDELTSQMIKLGRLTMVILLYMFGAFLLMGRDFIHLWVGDTYKNAWLIALLIMFVYILPIAQGYSHSILAAKKKLQFKTVCFLIFCSFGVVLGWLLSYLYAGTGMIIGLFTGMAIFQIMMNFYYHNRIGLNILRFFKKAIFPFIIPFMCVITVNLLVGHYYRNISWLSFLTKSIIYSILYLPTIYIVLNKEEKMLYLKKLK